METLRPQIVAKGNLIDEDDDEEEDSSDEEEENQLSKSTER